MPKRADCGKRLKTVSENDVAAAKSAQPDVT
jgi:hypothetical protein